MDLTQHPIVVGTDGSKRAQRAVAKAASLAQLSNARLHIVTSYARPLAHELPPNLGAVQRERLIAEIEATSEGLDRRDTKTWEALGVSVEFHRQRGGPVVVLHAVARRVHAGLIVVGNRGVDGPLGIVGRSLPHRVARGAPCDVLVVDTAA